MNAYFHRVNDMQYLDTSVRNLGELEFLVFEAKGMLERYVTSSVCHSDAFKVVETGLPDRYIYLRGYNPDPLLAPASLVDRVKRCIAHIVRWRSQSRGLNPHVQSEGGQQSGKSFNLSNVRETIPIEALRYLDGYLIETVATFI
jgi:hypothetical protein